MGILKLFGQTFSPDDSNWSLQVQVEFPGWPETNWGESSRLNIFPGIRALFWERSEGSGAAVLWASWQFYSEGRWGSQTGRRYRRQNITQRKHSQRRGPIRGDNEGEEEGLSQGPLCLQPQWRCYLTLGWQYRDRRERRRLEQEWSDRWRVGRWAQLNPNKASHRRYVKQLRKLKTGKITTQTNAVEILINNCKMFLFQI